MKCDKAATVGQGGQSKAQAQFWLVCEAGQSVATELVGPVVLGARNMADRQTDAAGIRQGGHQAQKVAKRPGGRKEFVAARFCAAALLGLMQGIVEV